MRIEPLLKHVKYHISLERSDNPEYDCIPGVFFASDEQGSFRFNQESGIYSPAHSNQIRVYTRISHIHPATYVRYVEIDGGLYELREDGIPVVFSIPFDHTHSFPEEFSLGYQICADELGKYVEGPIKREDVLVLFDECTDHLEGLLGGDSFGYCSLKRNLHAGLIRKWDDLKAGRDILAEYHHQQEYLSTPIEALDLDTRVVIALRNAGIFTFGDFLDDDGRIPDRKDLLSIKGIGDYAVYHIYRRITSHGFHGVSMIKEVA